MLDFRPKACLYSTPAIDILANPDAFQNLMIMMESLEHLNKIYIIKDPISFQSPMQSNYQFFMDDGSRPTRDFQIDYG